LLSCGRGGSTVNKLRACLYTIRMVPGGAPLVLRGPLPWRRSLGLLGRSLLELYYLLHFERSEAGGLGACPFEKGRTRCPLRSRRFAQDTRNTQRVMIAQTVYHFSIGCLQYEQGQKLSELPLFNEVLHKRARSRVFSMPHQLRRTKKISFSYSTWLCERGEYASKNYPHNQTVDEEAPVAGRGTV
jgi:hypothetical protein